MLLPPPNEWAPAIGEFFVAFNETETNTNSAIGYLFEQPVADILYGRYLHDRLCFVDAAIKSPKFSEAIQKEVSELVKAFTEMSQQRNTIAHGTVYWEAFSDENGFGFNHKLNQRTGKPAKAISLDKLETLTAEVRLLNKKYYALTKRIFEISQPEAAAIIANPTYINELNKKGI